MELWIQILIFVIIALILSIAITLPFSLAVNKLFIKASVGKIVMYTMLVNTLFFVSLAISMRTSNTITRILHYYEGAAVFAFVTGVLFWILFAILTLLNVSTVNESRAIKLGFILFFIILNLTAIYNYQKPISVEKFTIESDKVTKEYRFVHVADTQLGTTSVNDLNKVVNTIADQNPNFVVFVGDLVDSSRYTLEDFDIFKKINVPIFFERGNHEFYHDEMKLLDLVNNIHSFVPLINENTSFEEIDIVSIDYNQNKEHFVTQLAKFKLDTKKFSLLLYHDPKQINYALGKGFDLILAGHTHGGQIWPVTWIIDLLFEYGDGYFIRGKTHIYTTDGAGLWGPRMRLGSQNEIAVFTIKPKEN